MEDAAPAIGLASYSLISLRAVVTYLERLSSIAPREFMAAAGDEPAAAALLAVLPRPPFSFTTVSMEEGGRLPADAPASDDDG